MYGGFGLGLEMRSARAFNLKKTDLPRAFTSVRLGVHIRCPLAGTMQMAQSSLLDLFPICFVARRLRILFQSAPSSLHAYRKNLLRNDFPPNCTVPA